MEPPPYFMFLLVEVFFIYTVFLDDKSASPYWVPFVVALFGYFLLVVLVKYETGVYRRILLKALSAEVISNSD